MSEIFESREQFVDWATGPGLRIIVTLGAGLIASLLMQRLIRVVVRPRMLAPGFQGAVDLLVGVYDGVHGLAPDV